MQHLKNRKYYQVAGEFKGKGISKKAFARFTLRL